MNILHCICSLNTGGAEKLLIDLLNNIEVDKTDKISVCITNDSYDNNLLNGIDKRIEVHLLKRKEGSINIKYILNFIKLIRSQNIDIIHCHNRGSYRFALIAKIITGLDVKIVYTIHATNIYNKIKGINVFLDKIFVDKFIAISDSVQNDILSRNIEESKISLIYNGIDIKKFSKVSSKSIDKNNVKIGCVSRIVPQKKGQDLLIESINIIKQKYPGIKCMFAGDVVSIHGKKDIKSIEILKKQVEQLQLSNNIEFIGNVNDIPEFLDNIDIFVLPSRQEGFGLALVEAMASKRPVIASNIEGPRKIIGSQYGLLFEKNNYKELAEKISNVIENYNDIDLDKTFNYVNQNYSIEKMAKLYYQLYISLNNLPIRKSV